MYIKNENFLAKEFFLWDDYQISANGITDLEKRL